MKKLPPNLKEVAFARIKAAMKGADLSDEGCGELFDDSELVVKRYLEAVKAKNLDLPSRDALGIACFWIAFLTDWSGQGDLTVIERLLAPEVGVSLFEIQGDVETLYQGALNWLEEVKKRIERENVPPLSDDDLPF